MEDRGSAGPLRVWMRRGRRPHAAVDGRPGPPPVPLEREPEGEAAGLSDLTAKGPPEDEPARIRGTCEELGADEEMTELVLASHRHDRAPLDAILSEGGDVGDYVRGKLAIQEAIFDTDAEPSPD